MFKFPFFAPFDEHLLRSKACQQFVDVFRVAFCHEIFARRDVEQRQPDVGRAEMQRRKEVVFAARQHIVTQSHTWRHQLRDAAFHQLLGEFRIFELVANRHAKTGADEPRQVVVEGVVRKARHLRGGVRPFLVALRQRDAQHLRGDDRILTIGFVKVAAAKQQYRVGVRRFHVVKLPHHRSEFFFGHREKCVGI